MSDSEHRTDPELSPSQATQSVHADRGSGPKSAATGSQSARFHNYPFYAPRFWHGMRPHAWWGLLRQGRFRIHLTRLPYFVGVSFATPFNTVLALLQRVIFGNRLAAAELEGPPVFIVGHWRSGTTLMHELMVKDERYSSPSTFQCFAPNHFLLTEWFFRRFLNFLLPGKRPMDNMEAGWERPQEDEFALLNLGLPSPYRRIAFPLLEPIDLDYLDFEGVPAEDVQTWLSTLRKFLLAVSAVTGRPLVVKSPTHTGRIAQLAQEFPEARFIHVTRHPDSLFPSTCRLWQSLSNVQGLQPPADPKTGTPEQTPEKKYVIECLRRMYDSFHRARPMIDPHRIVDIRYEDLAADPVATMQHVYRTLKLSDFESVRPVIDTWAAGEHRNYQTNRHQLSPEDSKIIREVWKDYFDTYGYNDREQASQSS